MTITPALLQSLPECLYGFNSSLWRFVAVCWWHRLLSHHIMHQLRHCMHASDSHITSATAAPHALRLRRRVVSNWPNTLHNIMWSLNHPKCPVCSALLTQSCSSHSCSGLQTWTEYRACGLGWETMLLGPEVVIALSGIVLWYASYLCGRFDQSKPGEPGYAANPVAVLLFTSPFVRCCYVMFCASINTWLQQCSKTTANGRWC